MITTRTTLVLAAACAAAVALASMACTPRPGDDGEPDVAAGDTIPLDGTVDSTDIAAVAAMLARQRSAWEAQAVEHYRFTFVPRCFCPPARIAIEVDGDSASMVGMSGDSIAVRLHVGQGLPTIDSLFARLARAVDDDPAEMRVRYDTALHFPAESWIDVDRGIADEENGFEVDSLVVIRRR